MKMIIKPLKKAFISINVNQGCQCYNGMHCYDGDTITILEEKKTMGLALYQIANEYRRAFDELSAMEDITEDIIKDSLVNIESAFNDKVLNIAAYIKNLEAEELAIQRYIADMSNRKNVIARKINRFSAYLKHNLQDSGLCKVVGNEFDVALRNSPGSVFIEDESKLPAKFIEEVVEKKVLRTEIAKAIKAGEQVEGARLEKSQYLVIK